MTSLLNTGEQFLFTDAHIAKQVNVSWFEDNAISVNPEIGLPEFKITFLKEDYCNGTYRYALMPNSSKLGTSLFFIY